tara:strand:- start:8200 stop:9273 length:1074 start_codon:yes stop_codon:yes gene_type:complete
MSKKIEIIGAGLVITDTVSGLIEVSQPAKEVWYNEVKLQAGTVKIESIRFLSESEEYILYPEFSLANAVDTDSVAFTESTFRTFCTSNLAPQAPSVDTPISDAWIEHAKRIIFADDGVSVTLEAKNKDLLKFGRNKLCNTSKSTLMTLPVGTDNEVLVATNIINSIISDDAGDTETVTVEGHTTADGGLTFASVTQQATLTGLTVKALTTPLARVSRVVNNSSTDLTGNIYVTETDTYTLGVPDTDNLVHLIVEAGLNNSEKGATTLANGDYWILQGFYSDCLEKTATFGTVHLEVRESGKTFINRIDISASRNHNAQHKFKPYVIVKPNSDIRLRVSAGAAGKDFSGGIEGVLMKA